MIKNKKDTARFGNILIEIEDYKNCCLICGLSYKTIRNVTNQYSIDIPMWYCEECDKYKIKTTNE